MTVEQPAAGALAGAREALAARRAAWIGLGIAGVALVIRLCVGLYFVGEPVWDGHYYHFGAVRLAEGLGYSEDVLRHGVWVWKPWTHYPVGYSFWLSAWYRVFGGHLWVAPVSNAVAGAFMVFAVHRLALPMLGAWRAHLAASLVALHPGLVLYTAVTMSEGLAAALLLAALLPLGKVRWGWLRFALAGVLLGASVLVRPTSLMALPLFWLLLDGKLRKRAASLVALALGCGVTILPWTLRNCYRMDGCALVSTNAGWNLAIGALTETGRFRPLHAADGCPVVTGQVQQDRCWAERGMAVIRQHPWRWLSLAPKKLEQTFNHESFAVEYLREANPAAWPEPRRVAWREHLTDAHRWIVAMAAFSVVSLGIRRGAARASAARGGAWLREVVSGAWLREVASGAWLREVVSGAWLREVVSGAWLREVVSGAWLREAWRGGMRNRVALCVQWTLIVALLALTRIVFASDEHPVYWLILAMVALAVLPLPGRPPLGGLVGFCIGFVALTALSHVIFFGDDRYHLVVSPLLCVLAAAALRSRA
jgi:4-amino-4-deoxy-L-arabinose transferase-like glycosyltransferase